MHYANELPMEKESTPLIQVHDTWPHSAQIRFDQVQLIYPSRPDIAALKKISFHIKAGQKIGVVGKSGSGKSSLVAVLFQLFNQTQGIISIDDQGKVY